MKIAFPAALAAFALVAPAQTRNRPHFQLSVETENAEHCSDMRVRSSNGEVAQAVETVTLGPRDAAALELDDNSGRAAIRVRAWDQPNFVVETCKLGVAESRAAAEQLISGISVSHSAGRFTTSGPNTDSGNWQVYFLIRAPRSGNLDLQTKNGPISVAGMSGTTKVKAINGPVSLTDCAGHIEAHTTNGPISFNGGGGDVRLDAQNGPISLQLAGETWNGAQLEADTQNGPVSIHIPENYRTGVRFQMSGHAPLSCNIEACRQALAFNDLSSSERVIRINGSADTIRISTNNGPLSINGPKRRVI